MTDFLARLINAKSKADAATNLEKFIAIRRAAGWSEADITEYRNSVETLMSTNDARALALFPGGTYQTAEQARQETRKFWASLKPPISTSTDKNR